MRKILAVIAVLATAGLAACSSSSSSSSTAPVPRTGTEVITGTTTSVANAPTIPLKASGLFADTGSITLSGNSNAGTDTLKLSKGGLRVYHKQTRSPGTIFNPRTCSIKFSETGTFHLVPGSTGAYKGITGKGTYWVVFTATMPRLTGGRGCDNSQNVNPVPGSALTTFTVTGTFTLPAA